MGFHASLASTSLALAMVGSAGSRLRTGTCSPLPAAGHRAGAAAAVPHGQVTRPGPGAQRTGLPPTSGLTCPEGCRPPHGLSHDDKGAASAREAGKVQQASESLHPARRWQESDRGSRCPALNTWQPHGQLSPGPVGPGCWDKSPGVPSQVRRRTLESPPWLVSRLHQSCRCGQPA